MTTALRPLPFRIPAGIWLLLVFAVEFLAFDRWGCHQHTRIYPRWNDQIQYLTEAYEGYEHSRAHGFAAGIAHTLTNPSAQGTLHDFYALLVFCVAGPSRSAALAINLLALLVWQGSLFLALRRLRAPPALAFLAALLPLALAGPWIPDAGSAYDFRLDHLTMCTFGVTLSLGLMTDRFSRRGWTLLFGAAVGVTLLTRFLTGTYFVVIFGAGLAWTGCRSERGRRCANLLLAGLVAFLLAAPIFWINRTWVWNYYWIGHFVGPESAIRNQNYPLGPSLAYIANNLGQVHIGAFFGGFVVVLTAALAALRSAGTRLAQVFPLWWFGAVFFLAPALVLTLHAQKSSVVLGILAPGLIVLATALWLTLAPEFRPGRLPGVLAAAATLACLGVFLRLQLRPSYSPEEFADLRRVTTCAEILAQRADRAGLAHPAVAVDYVTDALDAQVLRVVCYERLHRWVRFNMTLPTGIFAPEESLVWERVRSSDFVFLTAVSPTDYYPYDKTLAILRPALHAWCREHLRETGRFSFLGRCMVLYQRREIPLDGPAP